MSTDDEKISSLYHKADVPGPSKTLDETILAASRDAVEKPAAAKGPFTGGWPAAASIAAVIVITIILVPILKQEEPQQALTQTDRDKSNLPEITGKPGLNTDGSTALKKKTMGAPAPASEPVMLLEEDLFADDLAVPAASAISSRAARAPATSETSFPEKKEQLESDNITTERSRMQAADSAPFAIHTPEMWEVKISRLIEQGDLIAAKAEIEKLKKQYPKYQINRSLLEKLDSYYE